MTTEILSYHTQQNDNTTSVGMRISFARMGYYFFKLKPLTGWGDKGFKDHIDDAEIAQFADKYTREFALGALFHNEFTTNAVLWGIGGLIATFLLFFAPTLLFIAAFRTTTERKIALYSMTYILFEFVSSLSTEVWNLKFTAALAALIIAGLCGTSLSSQFNHPAIAKNLMPTTLQNHNQALPDNP
jgi:O-antigen ligase